MNEITSTADCRYFLRCVVVSGSWISFVSSMWSSCISCSVFIIDLQIGFCWALVTHGLFLLLVGALSRYRRLRLFSCYHFIKLPWYHRFGHLIFFATMVFVFSSELYSDQCRYPSRNCSTGIVPRNWLHLTHAKQ